MEIFPSNAGIFPDCLLEHPPTMCGISNNPRCTPKLDMPKFLPECADLLCRKATTLILISSISYSATFSVGAAEPSNSELELETVVIEGHAATKVGPMEGLQLEREQIPANVQSLSSKDIKESLSTSLGDLMNSKLQSVNVNDYAGNPFQMDITFRGFSASPQIGTPQGLSVFFDGVRVNEPFGDIVNWDLIPLNAISSMDVYPGSNPIFGLNTLGGAISLRSKNGFDDTGVNVAFQGGSWDRKKGEISAGWNNGTFGAFAAFTGFDEEGWRTNSPSQVNQGFARFDWRGDDFSLRFSTLAIGNNLIGNGLIPMDLYNKNPESVFTSPDQTENELQQYTLGGEFFFNDNLSLTGQIYRRDSNRSAIAGDIYEDFSEMAGGRSTNVVEPSDGVTTFTGAPICRFADANQDKIPDYFVPTDVNGDGYTDESDYTHPDGTYNIDPKTVNALITPANINDVEIMPALNGDKNINFPTNSCSKLRYFNPGAKPGQDDSERFPNRPRNGRTPNGLGEPTGLPGERETAKGWIDGTPIGVLSKTELQQQTDGANLQLNWNNDQHKFMLGGSIDASSTDFDTRQRLGLMDANRRVYSAPNEIDPIFIAAKEDIRNNSFNGKSTTVSGYFSETYSPWDNLHLSVSGRFNHTRVKNSMSSRARAGADNLHSIADMHGQRPDIILCDGGDLASCGNKANYFENDFDREAILAQLPRFGFGKYKDSPSEEIFDYTAFNPSIGISYLPFKDQDVFYKDLNLIFNWSRGTRAPSSVELGCAYDGTLVPSDPGNPDNPTLSPKSLATVGGACTLPTTLSGDPYLPQIKADSYEFGLRGKLFEGSVTSLFHDMNWNASIYRTDLRNDIYLVGITPDRSFFDTIGDTRRQGIEFGFSGKAGIVDFSVNYGYTDATFQSDLIMLSPHNSSAENRVSIENDYMDTGRSRFDAKGRPVRPFIDMTQINKGDRMPGIPLHNINATLNFHLTPKWEFGVTMIAHSDVFVRGNENNDHVQGTFDQVEKPVGFDPVTFDTVYGLVPVKRQFKDSGLIPGYAIFNLKTRYELVKGLSIFGMVNNLFDRRYATAGRLGINPFSPSQKGAVGPSGWNYNSDDWQNSTFIGPGAPRAFWVGFDYKFDP